MKTISENFTEKIKALLTKEKKILITGHFNPDGDSLGGSLGLYHVLQNAGFKVSVMMPSDISASMKWLPGTDKIEIYGKETSELIKNADVIFFVDFNSASRTENATGDLMKSNAVKIILDHHPDPSDDAQLVFSDTDMSSASEIVYTFIKMIGFTEYTDKNVATCIYTGIMTDTLNFSVNSSRPETFETVAELLSYGTDKDGIYDKVNNNFSEKRLRLIGYLIYEKMKILPDLQFSYMIISKKELEKFNFKNGDHEGIVNMPLSVSTVKVSLIAIETDDYVKISLRSKGNFDVNLLSNKYFNGGGHKNAAGGRIYKAFSEVEKFIVDSVKEYIK